MERKKYIITFKKKDERPDSSKDKIKLVKSAASSRVQINADVNEYEVPIVAAEMTEEDAQALEQDENVAVVEEDKKMYALNGVPQMSNLVYEGIPTFEGETVPQGINQVKAPQAWNITKGYGIKIAILDTGVDYNHPDLAPNWRGGMSFVEDEPDVMDYNGHGTHCAGIAAAAITGSGIVGVAPQAALYGVKVLDRYGSGYISDIISGIEWAAKQGIHILSMSLGADESVTAFERMVDWAYKTKGVLLVAASGNESGPVSYPARYTSVVAVGAIDHQNKVADFSNYGQHLEVCAPGVDIMSCKMGGGYIKYSGTSMACPHVAGVAALAWGSHRHGYGSSIRTILQQTADDIGTKGKDEYYGYGRIDAWQATDSFKLKTENPAT